MLPNQIFPFYLVGFLHTLLTIIIYLHCNISSHNPGLLVSVCVFQLGGDFVVDEHGRVLFSHCCQSPIDRPSVEDILSGQ